MVEDTQKSKGVSPKRELSVKLVPLSDKDDIEAYLVTFERVMTAQKIDIGCWSQYLAPQLTGKAQLAFAALASAESPRSKFPVVLFPLPAFPMNTTSL